MKQRDSLILLCRYEDKMTYKEIVERFCITSERVQQLVAKRVESLDIHLDILYYWDMRRIMRCCLRCKAACIIKERRSRKRQPMEIFFRRMYPFL